jgi:hypothetical protein
MVAILAHRDALLSSGPMPQTAQPLPNNRGPDQAPRRLKAFFLDGLAPPAR